MQKKKSGVDLLKEKQWGAKCAAVGQSNCLIMEPWDTVLKGVLYRNTRTNEVIRIVGSKVRYYSQWSDNGNAIDVPGSIEWQIERGCNDTEPQTIKWDDIFVFEDF